MINFKKVRESKEIISAFLKSKSIFFFEKKNFLRHFLASET